MKKRLLTLFFSAALLLTALALPASAARIPFRDVPEDYFAYDDIVYVFENGLMNGTSADQFSPYMEFSRAMFVTMLGRLEGIDVAKYPGSAFSDVPAGNWAAPYISWASAKGIVNGVGGGKFMSDTTITAEQYATIVCRYLSATGRDFPGESNWKPEISDMEDVSGWARVSVINMAWYGMMDLTPDWQFIPGRRLDRTDIARYFTRLHALVKDGLLSAVPDPGVVRNQTGETILASLKAAAAYNWNWFYINGYTDSSDTITAYYTPYNNNVTYERVINPYVNSTRDLTELGYQHYVFDPVQQFRDFKLFREANGELYLSAVDGLGGFMYDGLHLDLMQTSDTEYEITVEFFVGTQLMDSCRIHYLYDGSRWVFGDSVPVELCWLDNISISWG